MRSELPATVALGGIFILCIMGGILISDLYGTDYLAFGTDTGNPMNALEYVALILAFTFGILLTVKYVGRKAVKYLFLGITGFTVYFVLVPIIFLTGDEGLTLAISLLAAGVFTIMLYFYPEWWVIDAAGILMAVGLTAILGISFGPLPALLLLAILAVYDAIAVYQTKHMIELADTVVSENLPIMFVIPKKAGYSFLKKEKGLKQQIKEGGERDALFMGLGDVIIPGALVVSAYRFGSSATDFYGVPGNIAVAMITLVGGFVGFFFLMRAVLKGNPQAGLPLLNGGTVAAYIVASFVVWGNIFLG